MKRIFRTNFLAVAALALGAFGVATTAHARSDVYFSVGVQAAPGFYEEPAPVYVQPRPVYIQPRPVYVAPRPIYSEPPMYAAPTEVYVRPGPPAYEYSYDDERARRRAEWRHRYWRHHHQEYQSRGRDWD
jgi:hypothetical protein